MADRLRPLRGEHRRLGRAGERAAERYLKRRGYRTLGRNLRSRTGELDLVMRSPEGAVVVVEVKSSWSTSGGSTGSFRPEYRVNAAKRRKIVALATQLARREKLQNQAWRFDVVGVEMPHDGKGEPTVRHYVGAFDAGF